LVAVVVVHLVMVVVAVLVLLSLNQVMDCQVQHIRSPSVPVVLDKTDLQLVLVLMVVLLNGDLDLY
tara:strand:- start:54 stop:251 length:198 start_codon:yes stop_codon:yes gene_type:complete